jgi:putative NADPH-quinone reductase
VARRITIILGHPDPLGGHYCHALTDAYAAEAVAAGHEVRRIDVAALDIPLLRNKDEFERGVAIAAVRSAQATIHWADHLLILYPLWMGMMPAVLKAFFEQVLRPGFSHRIAVNGMPERLLKGRSARIVVTMGMPAFAYRWLFGAHGVKALRRSVLWLCGIGPVRQTLIGGVESLPARERGIEELRKLGQQGQ